jgi:PPOX class probable F420-dependent enzyme
MTELTEAQRAFVRENPFYGVVTTLRKDGSPHSTVVWVDEQDGEILFNTAYPRAKARHLDRDPRASVVVVDPEDAYRWLAVSGPVRLSTDGANDDIDRLSRKYDGHEYRSHKEGQTRVSAWLTPEHVKGYNV